MSVLSLSRNGRQVYPDEIDGCKINPGFRNILRILRLLAAPNIFAQMKYGMALEFFYVGEYPEDAEGKLMRFIGAGQSGEGERAEEPRMDFEFDADEIYASFLAEYGIDLLEEDMHWYRFLVLMGALSPKCALQRKIELRFKDLKGLKGKELAETQAAKESVQLPEAVTMEDEQEAQAFEEMWGRM